MDSSGASGVVLGVTQNVNWQQWLGELPRDIEPQEMLAEDIRQMDGLLVGMLAKVESIVADPLIQSIRQIFSRNIDAFKLAYESSVQERKFILPPDQVERVQTAWEAQIDTLKRWNTSRGTDSLEEDKLLERLSHIGQLLLPKGRQVPAHRLFVSVPSGKRGRTESSFLQPMMKIALLWRENASDQELKSISWKIFGHRDTPTIRGIKTLQKEAAKKPKGQGESFSVETTKPEESSVTPKRRRHRRNVVSRNCPPSCRTVTGLTVGVAAISLGTFLASSAGWIDTSRWV